MHARIQNSVSLMNCVHSVIWTLTPFTVAITIAPTAACQLRLPAPNGLLTGITASIRAVWIQLASFIAFRDVEERSGIAERPRDLDVLRRVSTSE